VFRDIGFRSGAAYARVCDRSPASRREWKAGAAIEVPSESNGAVWHAFNHPLLEQADLLAPTFVHFFAVAPQQVRFAQEADDAARSGIIDHDQGVGL